MKTKILFVNGNLAVGGVERALVNLLNGFDNEKYEVDVLLLQSGYDYENELPSSINVIKRDTADAYGPLIRTLINAVRTRDCFSLGLRLCILLGKSWFRLLKKSFGIKKSYDLAISFRPGFCEDIVLNVVSAKKKFTWWHNGDFNIAISKSHLLSNWAKFDRVITVSSGIAEQLKLLSDDIASKLAIVPNIIDPETVSEMAGDVNPYRQSEVLKIITVSRLSKEKNLLLIIDIARELKKLHIDFVWNIIGDGDIRPFLEAAIEQYNLSKEVILQGKEDNPYPWIKHADIMVHPSRVESFGIVLLEAMALGVPCVSAKSLGAMDLIDGANGLILEDTPVEMAESIVGIINNQELYVSLCNSGMDTANRYTAKAILPTLEDLIFSDN
ncbi:glycosyltransferase [uncultured Muribaculum sp.]|uniref:glycosyltransferase n=1 Tax=uncultured Muribaculum sp. TaxID=1918613 RepID=UPI0025AE8A3E|nr:glycosyltransferase [uncultured Muribaculum sp.]